MEFEKVRSTLFYAALRHFMFFSSAATGAVRRAVSCCSTSFSDVDDGDGGRHSSTDSGDDWVTPLSSQIRVE